MTDTNVKALVVIVLGVFTENVHLSLGQVAINNRKLT